MVKRSLSLNIDGRTYQVEVLRPGVLSIDGQIVNVEITDNGVSVEGEPLVASLSKGFAIVGGKLYETEWEVD
jgi:hypothetical protein